MCFLHKNIFGVYASKDLVFHFFLLLFSCSVMSNSSWPHGLQHTKHPCSSPSPGACSNSSQLSQWCPSTISSSIVPFSSCLQSFPASWYFPVNFISLSYRKLYLLNEVSSVQSLSRVWLFVTPWTEAHQVSLSITNSWSLLKLMSIKSMMPSNHLKLWHPHLLLPSIFPSISVYSNESVFAISNETKVISMVVIKPEKSKREKTQVHCLSFFLLLFIWNGIIYPSSYLSSQSIKSYWSLLLG